MVFNSLSFLVFFPIFFILYWFCFKKKLKLQNALILIASYFFYGSWDYRFLFLLLFSTVLDYFSGLQIERSKNQQQRKIWLLIAVFINVGLLLFFKYFNFFADSLSNMLQLFGIKADFVTLNIILPIGISFYTFHGLSYVFDIYNNKIKASKNFIDYSVFVSFFPLLVAGPIERASHLLPEFYKPRYFNYSLFVTGMRQILWGLFKKVVIADNCGIIADEVFGGYANMPSTMLVLGAVMFSIQIYADFSGYSDIAIGLSRLLGFEILRNFSFPYFSRNIAEFWKRWHISLTSWFRDYLYIPLGGSKRGLSIQIRNTFIVFLVSGFWHGANITFLFWGLLHALLFIPILINGHTKRYSAIINTKENLVSLKDIHKIILTNILVVIAWIFFRSLTIGDAFGFISNLFRNYNINPGKVMLYLNSPLLIGIIVMVVFEWMSRNSEFGLSFLSNNFRFNTKALRFAIYFIICFLVVLNLPNIAKSFIYFQF